VARKPDPYELICNPDKTTLTCPGGIALGFGPGPGLRNAIFWNRIGSLFSSYRPAVAVLTLFDERDLRHPLPLKPGRTNWEPNLVTAHYSAPGMRIEERRTALKAGLRCLLKIKSSARKPRNVVLFFHGQVSQRPFFDYQRSRPEPLVTCEVEPHLRRIKLTQPHPHSGLGEVNSIQTITASHRLDAYGFGADIGDLYALWQDHGALACLRLRLGQVGGRLSESEEARGAELSFRHRHPLYYFALRLRLEPGEMQLISVAAQHHTDDEGGKLPGAYDGTATDEWQEYLTTEVPQLDCDDPALMRYWYYVWYVLLANRTARGMHIRQGFTAPSKYLYWGPWIWDGYFHVLGEMWMHHRETARNSIRSVLDMQFPNGYLPVCSGSQYRMCFHEEIDGYTSPDGGGYASYIPSLMQDYKERKHPFEAELEYFTQPARPAGGNGNRQTAAPESRTNRQIEQQMPEFGPEDYVVIPTENLIKHYAVTRRQYPVDESKKIALIDLGAVSFADTTGLAYLAVFVEQMNAESRRVIFYGADPQVRQVLSSLKPDRQLDIAGSYGEALTRAYQSFTPDQPVIEYEQLRPRKLAVNEKTQTPLITVAAAEYCRLHQDSEFAREVLPALLSYDDWLWRRRTDRQGRFMLWHGDESGWDNATRHYPVPAKPFDVQVHCLLHREALLELMQIAGDSDSRPHSRRDEIARRARTTRRSLNTYWDRNDRWHYDFGAFGDGQKTGRRRKQIAASGLYAMLTMDSNQVTEACLNSLQHERVFASEYPIPTLAKCDPDYAPHSWGWNGPVWLQVNYLAIVGLLRQRQYEAAFALWEQTKRLVIRNGQPNSSELYDPETGTGMGCPDYSWQAMLNHLVIRYFAGVGCPHLRPALPPGLNRLTITNLPGAIESIALRRRGKSVVIDVQYSAQGHPLCESLRPGWGSFPLLVPDGLGEIASISGNGRPFLHKGDWWEPAPDAGPGRRWKIKVTCR